MSARAARGAAAVLLALSIATAAGHAPWVGGGSGDALFARLFAWASENGAELSVRWSPSQHGGGLVAARKLGQGEAAVVIPPGLQMRGEGGRSPIPATVKRAVKAARKAGRLEEEDVADFGLVLHLLVARLDESSFFRPYVDALPAAEALDPPLAWGAKEATRRALEPLPLAELMWNEMESSVTRMAGECGRLHRTGNLPASFPCDAEGIRWAFSVIHSRAWRDADGVALVPVADLANHSPRGRHQETKKGGEQYLRVAEGVEEGGAVLSSYMPPGHPAQPGLLVLYGFLSPAPSFELHSLMVAVPRPVKSTPRVAQSLWNALECESMGGLHVLLGSEGCLPPLQLYCVRASVVSQGSEIDGEKAAAALQADAAALGQEDSLAPGGAGVWGRGHEDTRGMLSRANEHAVGVWLLDSLATAEGMEVERALPESIAVAWQAGRGGGGGRGQAALRQAAGLRGRGPQTPALGQGLVDEARHAVAEGCSGRDAADGAGGRIVRGACLALRLRLDEAKRVSAALSRAAGAVAVAGPGPPAGEAPWFWAQSALGAARRPLAHGCAPHPRSARRP